MTPSLRDTACTWAKPGGLTPRGPQNINSSPRSAIVEGAYGLYLAGKVDTPYARGLEYDVPALLQEAAQAAEGEW